MFVSTRDEKAHQNGDIAALSVCETDAGPGKRKLVLRQDDSGSGGER